ncbi:MAG: hypothetical protein V1897_05665 [Pseudomonadota bacterium]
MEYTEKQQELINYLKCYCKNEGIDTPASLDIPISIVTKATRYFGPGGLNKLKAAAGFSIIPSTVEKYRGGQNALGIVLSYLEKHPDGVTLDEITNGTGVSKSYISELTRKNKQIFKVVGKPNRSDRYSISLKTSK